MLRAFIDDSGKGDKNLFVLAGYISTAERWAAFSEEWWKLIDGSGPPHYRKLDYFKMAEMQSELDRERCGWFYRIIEDHVQAAISCVIDVPGLTRAVDSIKWPPSFYNVEKIKNPYFFAFKAIVNVLAQFQEKMNLREPVHFVFDEDTEKIAVLNAWEYLKLGSTPNVRNLMGPTPIYEDDQKALPLQAADLYAWWVRYWEVNGIRDGVAQLRFDWQTRKDKEMPRLHMAFTGDQIREHLEQGLDGGHAWIASLMPEDVKAALRAIEWLRGGRGPRGP